MRILFLSDIDGTLVTGHSVHQRVRESAEKFTREGNLFSLATGRNAFAILWLTDQLPVHAPCILLTGAALYDPVQNELHHRKPLPPQVNQALKQLYDAYPAMGIQVFTRSGLINLRLNPFLAQHGIAEEIARGVSDIRALEGEEILKIGLCCEDVTLISQAADRLFGNRDLYKWHFSFEIGAEIFSPAAGKGTAMEELLRDLPQKPDLVAVAGDSPNDLSMFPKADITFAPTNAFPEVKAQATHLIPPPEEGGVATALELLMKL